MDKPDLFKKYLRSAREFYRMAPWEWMEETDIFGVTATGSGKAYFISIMGNAGEQYALAAYEGIRAINSFWEIYDPESSLPPEHILTIPHILLSFHPAWIIEEEQRDRVEKYGDGFSDSDLLPELLANVPGLLPRLPDDEQIGDMIEVLEQTLGVCARTINEPELICPDGNDENEYFFREISRESGETGWEDRFRKFEQVPEEYTVTVSGDQPEQCLKLPRRPGIWQMDLCMLPGAVQEDEGPAWYPFLLLLVEKKSGLVKSSEILKPLPDMHSLYSRVPSVCMDLLIREGCRPYALELRNRLLLKLMEQVNPDPGINLNFSARLPAWDEAAESLKEHLLQGSSRGSG